MIQQSLPAMYINDDCLSNEFIVYIKPEVMYQVYLFFYFILFFFFFANSMSADAINNK